MFLTRSEYDRGVNTFSPEGRILQVEYAIEAIKLGSTALGIKTNEGVVLATEKRVSSSLLEPASLEKILQLDEHLACATSGLMADAKTLVDRARVEAASYWFTYNERIRLESLTRAVSNLALQFGDDTSDIGLYRTNRCFIYKYFEASSIFVIYLSMCRFDESSIRCGDAFGWRGPGPTQRCTPTLPFGSVWNLSRIRREGHRVWR